MTSIQTLRFQRGRGIVWICFVLVLFILLCILHVYFSSRITLFALLLMSVLTSRLVLFMEMFISDFKRCLSPVFTFFHNPETYCYVQNIQKFVQYLSNYIYLDCHLFFNF